MPLEPHRSVPRASARAVSAPVPAPAPSAGPATVPAGSAPQAAGSGPRQLSVETGLRPLLIQPKLRAGVFGIDLQSRAFFNVSGDVAFAAASLIKIPIAVALLTEADSGTISLEEMLEMKAGHVAAGSGSLQYLPVGSRFSIARLGELMIRRSDNTATNMLIDRLGGIEAVNRVFEGWGLSNTRVRSPLPDMPGTNTTSPRDLVIILDRAVTHSLLRPASRDRLLAWMRRSHVRSLLPAGVGPGCVVANKTGDIPGALGDAGYVQAPGGTATFSRSRSSGPGTAPAPRN